MLPRSLSDRKKGTPRLDTSSGPEPVRAVVQDRNEHQAIFLFIAKKDEVERGDPYDKVIGLLQAGGSRILVAYLGEEFMEICIPKRDGLPLTLDV
jgi:hypothetical protein